jgi:hypothetical protein
MDLVGLDIGEAAGVGKLGDVPTRIKPKILSLAFSPVFSPASPTAPRRNPGAVAVAEASS